MSSLNSARPDSLTSILFVKEAPLVRQARDEASHIRRYQVIRRRLIIKDDDNDDLEPYVMSSGKS